MKSKAESYMSELTQTSKALTGDCFSRGGVDWTSGHRCPTAGSPQYKVTSNSSLSGE